MKKKTLPYIYKTLSDSLKLTPNSSSDDVTEQDRHEDDATHPHRMVQLEEIKESEKQKLLPKGETTPKPFKDKMRIRFDIGRAFARQTLREIRKNKVSYLLGFMACFVVVLVVSLLLTILSNTPVVFLRLSELMAGEIDVQVQPEWPYSLNYNTFSSILTNPDFQYNSPRISGTINFYPTSQCEMEYNFDYDKDVIHCSGDNYRSYLYLIDSEKEKNMGLGRNWNLPPLGNAEIYLSSQTAKDIGVSKGQQVYLAVDLTSFLWIPYTHIETNATATPIWGSTLLLLTVKDTYSDPLGKYPQRYSRGAIMEYSKFLDTVLGQIGTLLSPSELAHTQQIDLYDYANQIIVNLPPQDRMAFYISSDYDQIQSNVVSFASNVMYDVGFNVASTRLQIVRYLKTYNILNLFLGLIINVIICILLFISTLLVYSLLVTNVESRTFEIGITRMFGMKRVEVIVMLMFQAFSYIVFSWPLGILASQGLAIYLSSAFEGLVSIKIDPKLTGDAIALSAIIGLIMPLFASIFPIRNALGHNLHDALDTRQSKTKAISISISRAESEVFSWSWIMGNKSTIQ